MTTRMMRTRARRRKRTGSSAAALHLLLAPAVLAGGGDKKRPQVSYAVVTGTVFREDGMSLPGAEVTLETDRDAAEAPKFKKMSVITSTRGEFALRVPSPAAPLKLKLGVKARGYQPQEKPITLNADESMDVFFRLEPASK